MMKTVTKFFMFAIGLGFIISCTPKPVKTIENLTAAYNGESTASSKYAVFAEKAKAEGLDTIAVMFQATSKAEAIHANNHLKVLEKLGTKVDGPQVEAYNVLSTAENLTDAINGETYEFETMYPGFIAVAEKEKSADAVKSFTWALDTEKKHQAFYKAALAALNGSGEKSLSANWFVCPVCGNTYDFVTAPIACDFCMTSKEKFIAF
jgi:rubrerythrin